MNKESIYFPNLNGLRFIAAFLVIIHHNEQLKSIFGIKNIWDNAVIYQIGGLGVQLFFVLSGFLITFLLLQERKKTNTIHVKYFYIRRILRIWPLYFAVVLLALFFFPYIKMMVWPGYPIEIVHSNLALKLFFFFTFFSNLVLSNFGVIPYASQTWSIGLEEQFYLVWPVIVKYVKDILLFLIGVLVVMTFLKYATQINWLNKIPFFWSIQWIFSILSRFESMAIGGVFAVIYFRKYKIINILKHPLFFYPLFIYLMYLILRGVDTTYYLLTFQLLFGVCIFYFASSKPFIILENPIMNYLGKISYGLYMLHPIAIVLSIFICKSLVLSDVYVSAILSLTLTILLATISYLYMEKRFLHLKSRFTTIVSGDDAREK
jgi:peptidoglycan/LPS O-acetylase OafA/YrhL